VLFSEDIFACTVMHGFSLMIKTYDALADVQLCQFASMLQMFAGMHTR
jgi:hypothetical protein